jgi:hypothetical protein
MKGGAKELSKGFLSNTKVGKVNRKKLPSIKIE